MSQGIETVRWQGDTNGHLVLLDQTRLPTETVYRECHTAEDVWQAIHHLVVRGAPAIGIAAAYGVCVGVNEGRGVEEVSDYLATSRPTAVNLFWALDRMRAVASRLVEVHPSRQETGALSEALLTEAKSIHEEDRQTCAAIGRHGAQLLADMPAASGILTHCNAGALATGGDGTALSVVFALADAGKRPHVWVDETRPLLQGARLTTWELMQRGIDCTLICDSVAAQVMREGRVQAVVTGADRIAACGDAANKIGTYAVATLAKAHNIPFYIAAPTSTFDLSIAAGKDIPIEERPAEEVTHGFGRQTAPQDVAVYSPAFDVTPAELITAIITERGIVRPVNLERVTEVVTAER